MPYGSEFGAVRREAVSGPTALQGLDGEQNVGIATTNGAIRLLHASYSLIPYLLENTELILRAACEHTPARTAKPLKDALQNQETESLNPRLNAMGKSQTQMRGSETQNSPIGAGLENQGTEDQQAYL